MANEITSGPGDGRGNYPLLFIFPIDIPIQWVTLETNVVPTPSDTLPDWAITIVTQGEKDALDSGAAMFYVHATFRTDGLTLLQMATKARALYAQTMTAVLARYENIYQYPGNRIDAE